ncbi:Universal stress protein UspA [Balamuthia mandrillaris]
MKYLVAVDGSVGASEAFKKTCELAGKRKEQSHVFVLTVVEEVSGSDVLDEDIAMFAADTLKRANLDLHSQAEALLKQAAKLLNEREIKHSTILSVGPARDKILELAEELNIDVIVLGSRGLGTLGRILIGSVSEHIALNAPCSVLVVRHKIEEDERLKRNEEEIARLRSSSKTRAD